MAPLVQSLSECHFPPIKLLSNQALAGESLQNPSLSSPNPTPAQEENCLEGPHCNAKEVAMETQAGWCATQRGKVPCVSCQAEEGAGPLNRSYRDRVRGGVGVGNVLLWTFSSPTSVLVKLATRL